MSIKPADQLLPLAGRYQAAWSEQCTRITLRQGVIQIYLATAAVLFGFWVSNQKIESNATPSPPTQSMPGVPAGASVQIKAGVAAQGPPKVPEKSIDGLLVIGVTALTVYSTMLVYTHNRIIQRLTEFMSLCEYHARDTITIAGAGTYDLFNFHNACQNFADKSPPTRDTLVRRVVPFHRNHRLGHRMILATILGVTNAAAFYLTWSDQSLKTVQMVCMSLLICCLLLLVGETLTDLWNFLKGFPKAVKRFVVALRRAWRDCL